MAFIELKYGSTRTVVLIGRYAVKVPSTVEFKLFLYGLLGNMQESRFSGIDDRFCPVLWSLPCGLALVMTRARPLERQEFFEMDYAAFVARSGNRTMCLVDMVENKLDSFGIVGGRLVAVDYGS